MLRFGMSERYIFVGEGQLWIWRWAKSTKTDRFPSGSLSGRLFPGMWGLDTKFLKLSPLKSSHIPQVPNVSQFEGLELDDSSVLGAEAYKNDYREWLIRDHVKKLFWELWDRGLLGSIFWWFLSFLKAYSSQWLFEDRVIIIQWLLLQKDHVVLKSLKCRTWWSRPERNRNYSEFVS